MRLSLCGRRFFAASEHRIPADPRAHGCRQGPRDRALPGWPGSGLVDRPAYPASGDVQARAIAGASLAGRIPYGKPLECRCHKGDCNTVEFKPAVFEESIRDRNILAITSEFDSAIASTSKGTLALSETPTGLQIAVRELADTGPARDLLEQIASVGAVMRPIFADPIFTEAGTGAGLIATYTAARLRAILIGPADVDGWPEAVLEGTPEPKTRARRRLWL